MNILLKKRDIINEIDHLEDEKLLWAIARLLHMEEDTEIPEWHKQILAEREEKYSKSPEKMKDWGDVKKTL